MCSDKVFLVFFSSNNVIQYLKQFHSQTPKMKANLILMTGRYFYFILCYIFCGCIRREGTGGLKQLKMLKSETFFFIVQVGNFNLIYRRHTYNTHSCI